MPVTQLAGLQAERAGDDHVVVVDQRNGVGVGDEDVAMLQIAVRDLGGAQIATDRDPLVGEAAQARRVVEVLLDVGIKPDAVRPIHFEDRIPAAAHANPLRQILEIDHEGQRSLLEVGGNGGVALLLIGDFAHEAAHRRLALLGFNLKDGGEIAEIGRGSPKRLVTTWACLSAGSEKARLGACSASTYSLGFAHELTFATLQVSD